MGNTLTCLICGVIHTITHYGEHICANEDILKVNLSDVNSTNKKKVFPKAELNTSKSEILAAVPDNIELLETMKTAAVVGSGNGDELDNLSLDSIEAIPNLSGSTNYTECQQQQPNAQPFSVT